MTADDDELRMLQTRAYGPDADIHADADALARLRSLEQSPQQPVSAPPAEPDAVDEDASGTDSAAEPPPARTRRSIRIPLLWAVSLVATALVAFGIARFAIGYARFHPLVSGSSQVATLVPNGWVPVPEFVASGQPDDTVVAYDDFLGMRTSVSTGPSLYSGGDGRCMTITTVTAAEEADVTSTESSVIEGPVFWGCAAGGFPATISFTVGDGPLTYPDELQAAYPAGTALQFVLDEQDDAIIVFVDR